MSLTLIQRETFQGVGTLDAGTPGNLGTVSGNFYKRAGGPRVSSDTSVNSYGWSADLQSQNDAYATFGGNTTAFPATPDSVPVMCDFWLYLAAPLSDNNHNKVFFRIAPNRELVTLYFGADGQAVNVFYNGDQVGAGATVSAYTVPLMTWVNFRVAWAYRAATYTEYDTSVLVRPAGASNFTEIANIPDRKIYGYTANCKVGVISTGGNYGLRGRIGMPSLYQLGAWSDRFTLVTDVVDPSGAYQWFCNPATGSDNNDGATSGTAWATVAKINTESVNCGMFPTAGGYVAGDTLTIDTSAANLVLGGASLNLNTRGLNVAQTGGGELQAWENVSGSGWTATSGAAGVYQRTLTSTDASCVMWEDDKWLAHATGANLAAAQSSLVSTAGSFWTDGTTMYVHPFGNTNPAMDNKVYTRSYNRGGNGTAAVLILALDLHLNGLHVRKTCLADKSTNDPVSAYCFQTQGAAGGTTLVENCYADYWSKHGFGYTDDSITRQYTTRNCQSEQGSPYVGAGGQTAWVDYANSSASNGTATSTYIGCTTLHNCGLIGSATGTNRTDIPAWISHNSGAGANQIAEVDFTNCNFGGGMNTYGCTVILRFTGGSCGGGSLHATTGYFNGVRTNGVFANGDAASGGVIVRNCIIAPAGINGGFSAPAARTLDYQGCTIDMRATTSNTSKVGVFSRFAAMAVTWRNNVFLGHASIQFPLIDGASSTDTMTFDHNAYSPGSGALLSTYNDGSTTADRTLAQWQALGKDTGSFATSTPKIGTNYKPQSGSPLIGTGADIGPLTDFAGKKTFNPRNDIGAYEYVARQAGGGACAGRFGFAFGFEV